MKTLITFKAMSSIAKISSLALIIIIGLCSFNNNNNNKITICHVPPGNPANCHEITISINALQPHLDHGDKLYCENEADYNEKLSLVGMINKESLVKVYQ